jgi:hypothetical protein
LLWRLQAGAFMSTGIVQWRLSDGSSEVSCELQAPVAGSIVATILYRDLPIRQVVLEHAAAMRWADLWQTKWQAAGWAPSQQLPATDLRHPTIDGVN